MVGVPDQYNWEGEGHEESVYAIPSINKQQGCHYILSFWQFIYYINVWIEANEIAFFKCGNIVWYAATPPPLQSIEAEKVWGYP